LAKGRIICVYCNIAHSTLHSDRFSGAEYSHIEAELDFITFDDLLDHIEQIVCRVIVLVLEDPFAKDCIKKYNPEFTKPARPFMRMRYSDAINWLRARGIQTPEGQDHVFGDDMLVPLHSLVCQTAA
jgi:aspartyl/asparaginyl-tRNA synthetase